MLEILVSLRRSKDVDRKISGLEKPNKKAGDIIVAKKSPAPWGTEEKRLFLITLLKDDVLEASMGDLAVHPYAVYGEPGEEGQPAEMISGSRYKVNVNVKDPTCLFIDSPGLDPDDMTEPVPPNGKDYLELSDLIDTLA